MENHEELEIKQEKMRWKRGTERERNRERERERETYRECLQFLLRFLLELGCRGNVVGRWVRHTAQTHASLLLPSIFFFASCLRSYSLTLDELWVMNVLSLCSSSQTAFLKDRRQRARERDRDREGNGTDLNRLFFFFFFFFLSFRRFVCAAREV